jgi:rod shape-determining protein MreC
MRFIYTKTFVIFFICLCVLTGLIFLNSRGGLDQIKRFFLNLPKPLVKTASYVSSGGRGFFSALYNLKSLNKENIELRNKVADLQTQLVNMEADARDNKVLRASLGFVQQSEMELAPCEALSGNVLNLTDSITLNCGLDDGIKEGQAVLSQGYVVGKINYVGKNTSGALLATSSKFLTDARVSKSGQTGVAEGSFNSGIVLGQLPQSAALEKGWLVVTAGINSAIPKDLLIGEVGEVISAQNDLFKKASLITPVDFNNLQFVFVVK